jgi:hypothetical protein
MEENCALIIMVAVVDQLYECWNVMPLAALLMTSLWYATCLEKKISG